MKRANAPARFTALLLLAVLLVTSFPMPARALEDPNIQAAAAYLADAETGMVLYEKNADQKRYPASTTKIMTALIVLENVSDLNEKVAVTESDFEGVGWDSSKAGFVVGEEIPIIDLLYGLLLPSGNEAANTLARHVGGSIEGFVDMMNERARALGCKNTHFVNPNGLHDDDHYTTAHDLYLIAAQAMKNETFALIANTAVKTLSETNKVAEHPGGKPLKVMTTNMLIFRRTDPLFYSYAKGIKTGHTSQAGYCFVSTAEKKDARLISVLLGCEKPETSNQPYTFSETKRLFEWGFDNFGSQTLVEKGQTLPSIPNVKVNLSTDTDSMVIQAADDLIAIVPNDIDLEKLVITPRVPAEVDAPVAAGQKLGEFDVSYNNVKYGTVDLVALSDASLSKVLYYADKLSNFFHSRTFKIVVLVLGAVLILYILFIVITGRRRRRKRRRAMRSQQSRYRRYK